VASGEGAATRMRHCIRRYRVFLQRVAAGEVRLVHVPDPVNHSDYLTKLVGSKKAASCDRYATNSRNEVPLDGDSEGSRQREAFASEWAACRWGPTGLCT
jgi:hypothetical protein